MSLPHTFFSGRGGEAGVAAFSFTISTNQENLNLATYATAQGWDGVSPVEATISSGVYIYSYDVTIPALTTGNFPNGLTIINEGYIAGKGGYGMGPVNPLDGSSAMDSDPPGDAGDAISLGCNVVIESSSGGYIGGGGGGGGGGYLTNECAGGGGGAGGGRGGVAYNKDNLNSIITTEATVGNSGEDAGDFQNAGAYRPLYDGRGGGSGGGGGYDVGGGGGGGWIFPGVGGDGATGGGRDGGDGGSGGNNGGDTSDGTGTDRVCGGGGGWGADGGTLGYTTATDSHLGALGGAAIIPNGFTVTWSGLYATNLSTYVFGAIS